MSAASFRIAIWSPSPYGLAERKIFCGCTEFLIDLESEDNSARLYRFYQYLKPNLPCNDAQVMIAASKALGKSTRSKKERRVNAALTKSLCCQVACPNMAATCSAINLSSSRCCARSISCRVRSLESPNSSLGLVTPNQDSVELLSEHRWRSERVWTVRRCSHYS